MKDTIWKRIIAVFAALLVGIGIASVVKDLTTMAVGEDVSADILQAREELAFEEANFRSQRLLNDRLEARKKLLLHSLSEQGVMSEIIAEHGKYAMLAGLTDVKGPGITIALNDKAGYDPLADPIESVIHDSTINYVINLLWSGGARAISFNDVRLTAVSEINCVGPTILAYGVRQMPPYVISAIGPVDELLDVVQGDSYLARLSQPEVGIRISISTDSEMILPSFLKSRDYSHFMDLLETP
ncbi:MAG TPA: DUF881 domain-containing protein [Bacillota bacterium]|jgi:uncharacterized protein YlxW (UPF0749 family)|nr:DUF881 domain-containing protein [Bacillota bacterium]HQC48037.1 DUF881 domain-containing protein [Bacillota bacterium]